MSPVRNSPELSNETRVEEEQRWFFRGHAQATLEIRRRLPGLKDGKRERLHLVGNTWGVIFFNGCGRWPSAFGEVLLDCGWGRFPSY